MYKQLQELYIKYSSQGFQILAFPCNQFGGQEPGNNDQIKQFAQEHGITFPIYNKIEVNGKNAHPLFAYLRLAAEGVLGNSIKWNFTKFLCNRQGKPIHRYGPASRPLGFEPDIFQLLQ